MTGDRGLYSLGKSMSFLDGNDTQGNAILISNRRDVTDSFIAFEF